MKSNLIQEKMQSSIIRLHPGILNFSKVILGSLFIGVCAQIRIPLWFTPIPITCQTLAVMLVGVTFGSRIGLQCVACYLVEGALGLPVYSNFTGGVYNLWGPSAGYLLAYIPQVYAIGKIKEMGEKLKGYQSYLLILSITLLQLSVGSFWLGLFVPFKNCFKLGLYPFVPGEILKISLVWAYLKRTQIKKQENEIC